MQTTPQDGDDAGHSIGDKCETTEITTCYWLYHIVYCVSYVPRVHSTC